MEMSVTRGFRCESGEEKMGSDLPSSPENNSGTCLNLKCGYLTTCIELFLY